MNTNPDNLQNTKSTVISKASPATTPRVKVWDIGVRIFHWGLVLCFAAAYILSEDNRELHEIAGYTMLGLVGFRILWGFVGSHYARFSEFFPTPARLFPYLKAMVKGQEPRYLGHNPAAAVMIFFLLAMCLCIGTTGYLMTTDWGWGNEVLEELHEAAVNLTLVAVVVHVAAAIYESIRHKESLIKAMLTGYKRKD